MTKRERKYHHYKWILKVANQVRKYQFTQLKIQHLKRHGKPAGEYIELLPIIERTISTMIS